MHTWEGWGMHGFWWLFGFAIIVIAIWLILRQLMLRTRNKHDTKDSAPDILEKRFARGEISKEEYEEARQAFKDNKSHTS